jgi:hypothetical protein
VAHDEDGDDVEEVVTVTVRGKRSRIQPRVKKEKPGGEHTTFPGHTFHCHTFHGHTFHGHKFHGPKFHGHTFHSHKFHGHKFHGHMFGELYYEFRFFTHGAHNCIVNDGFVCGRVPSVLIDW